jgi:hypothetical protein
MARNIERNRWHLQVSPSRDRPRGKPAERPGMVTCGRHLPGPFAGARPAAIPGGHEQMKYQWTDWITHVPGQVLPPGIHVLCEFQCLSKNNGRPYTRAGLITPIMRGWPGKVTKPTKRRCMLRRYKLRSIATEEAVVRSRRKRVPHEGGMSMTTEIEP